MREYEQRLYEQWHHQVEAVLPSLLRRNLLAKTERASSARADEGESEKLESEMGEDFFSFIQKCFILGA